MNSRKQRSASTHGDAFAGNHSEEHWPTNWSRRKLVFEEGGKGCRSLAQNPDILTSWQIVAGMAHSGKHPLLSPTASARQLTPQLAFNARAYAGYFYRATSMQSPQFVVY